MVIKKIGFGTFSLLLSILGFIWAVTFKNGFCLGDTALDFLGIKSWSNGNVRTHYAIFYSLLFFVPALIVGYKYPNNFGAKAGRMLAIIIGTVCISTLLAFTVGAIFYFR